MAKAAEPAVCPYSKTTSGLSGDNTDRSNAYFFHVTSSVYVYPVGASIDMVQVLSMEIAKSLS